MGGPPPPVRERQGEGRQKGAGAVQQKEAGLLPHF